MSVRVDALATDLIKQAQLASAGMKEPYLTALNGLLTHSGARISQTTRTAVGEGLQALLFSVGRLHLLFMPSETDRECNNS